jgi:hypothetical protein
MDNYQRDILSIFVDLQEGSPGEFVRYHQIVRLISAYYKQAKVSISTDEIDDAINSLIDDGYLEGMGTSYRLSAMGKLYWDYNSMLAEVSSLSGQVRQAKGLANLAMWLSLAALAGLVFLFLR